MRSICVALAALTSATAYARLTSEDHFASDSAWKRVSRVHPADTVKGFIAIHEQNIDAAENLLLDISNPRSQNFGKYLDHAGLTKLLQPSKSSFHEVVQWLLRAGIPQEHVRVKHASSVVDFTTTAQRYEDLFGADCHIYEHSDIRGHHVGCHGVEVPHQMRKHVEFVHPGKHLVRRSDPKLQHVSAPLPYKTNVAAVPGNSVPSLSRCAESWSPQCINELYGIGPAGKAAPNNTLGVYGYADIYEQADLNLFYNKLFPSIGNGTHPTYLGINSGRNISDMVYTSGEENLDLQMAYPIVHPQGITLWQVDDVGALQSDGFGNHFLDAVDKSYCTYDGGDDPKYDEIFPDFSHNITEDCGKFKAPNVLAVSYGVEANFLDAHYQNRQCREWMKLALQGVSVIVASGDKGVNGPLACAKNPYDPKAQAFSSVFPGICPYVTSVGATQINFTSDGKYKEVAVDDYPHKYWSGGGFSNTQPRSKWQDAAVENYLKAHKPNYPKGTYNASGRGFPDVALLGALVAIADQGKLTVSGGTSASTPLFAAMINKINDARLLAGKGPIGFLNQILYSHPEVFNDITEGHNPGCETDGFKAAQGWDPVTGLGSPKFKKLFDLLTGLP